MRPESLLVYTSASRSNGFDYDSAYDSAPSRSTIKKQIFNRIKERNGKSSLTSFFDLLFMRKPENKHWFLMKSLNLS